MNVFIVEDQFDLSELIAQSLKRENINADIANTGEEALDNIDPEIHDVVILDRGLPDMEGLDLLRILREEKIHIPVLVLTAKDDLGDKIDGLNSGADDYLVKPFEMEELIARLHALHRRPQESIDITLNLGNLEFMPSQNSLKINGKGLEISIKERDALERLLRHPNRVVTKDSLQSTLYRHGEEGSKNSVEVVIHRLRKKLEEAGASIEVKTLRGIGYMIKE